MAALCSLFHFFFCATIQLFCTWMNFSLAFFFSLFSFPFFILFSRILVLSNKIQKKKFNEKKNNTNVLSGVTVPAIKLARLRYNLLYRIFNLRLEYRELGYVFIVLSEHLTIISPIEIVMSSNKKVLILIEKLWSIKITIFVLKNSWMKKLPRLLFNSFCNNLVMRDKHARLQIDSP